jgi:mannan endo-1,4-beta-mannosidase
MASLLRHLQLVRTILDEAAAAGFTVMRAFAHGVTPQHATLGPDGQPVEEMLRGLDYLLAEAGKRGIKVR